MFSFNICNKYHIHHTTEGKDYCNKTGKSVNFFMYHLFKKPTPWEKDNGKSTDSV